VIHFFDAFVVFLLDYMLPRYIKRVDSFSDINIFNRKSNVHCVPKKTVVPNFGDNFFKS